MEFFTGEGVESVDAVSTATIITYNQTMAVISYHDGCVAEETEGKAGNDRILDVTNPVRVKDASVLERLTKVTDADKADSTFKPGANTTRQQIAAMLYK